MEKLEIALQDGRGEIQLWLEDQKVGFMEIAVSGERLTVYHTEVNPEHGGKGFARLLLGKLVSHARENALKVAPLCPYVHAQFKKNPDEYADIWYQRKSEV